jgi:YHS domain-containing protein
MIEAGVSLMREPFGLENHSDHEPVFSTDPVCGRKVDEEKAAAKIGFEGQMYYFCSKDCARAFRENPHGYAGHEPLPAKG